MRKIKFRVWDGECFRGNLEKYFLNLHSGEIETKVFSDLYDEWYSATDETDNFIIQQYTGLFDNNNVEICEGDIVHYNFDEASNTSDTVNKNIFCKYDSNNGWYVFRRKRSYWR